MSDPAEKIARLLGTGKSGKRPTMTKGGNWRCVCPAHDDKSPSLGIRWTGQRPVFQCYAGCDFRDVAKALRSRGIDPMTGEAPEWKPRQKVEKRETEKKKTEHPAKEYYPGYIYDPKKTPHWLENPKTNRPPPPGYKKTAYVYRDTEGWPTAVVFRYDKIDPMIDDDQKKMLILTPWINPETQDVIIPPYPPPRPIPPYGAESLHKPGPILIVEGEKCRSKLFGLLQGILPVITPLHAHLDNTDMSCVINSGRRTITFPDYENGDDFVNSLNEIIGDRNTICPSPWRLGDVPIPKGWDIADEINGKSPWEDIEISPLTKKELADHMLAFAETLDPGPDHDTITIAAKIIGE